MMVALVVAEEIKSKWNKWVNEMQYINEVATKRCVDDPDKRKTNVYELVTFTDASQIAYAAVTYLKITNGSFNTVNLVVCQKLNCSCKGNYDSSTRITWCRYWLSGI